MNVDVPLLLQAAVEYGAANSAAASRVAEMARGVVGTAEEAWSVVSADPVLLGGVVVVGILAALVLRNPAR